MNIRDRIKELRRVRAGDLQPHPKNWRTHPEEQNALRGILAESRKRKVLRYSASRLLREKVPVPAGAILSTELRRGQLMVCVARLANER